MSMVLGQTFANPASFSIGLIHPDSPATYIEVGFRANTFAKLVSQLHSFIRIHLPAVTSSVSNTSLQAFPALVAQLFELNFF